MAIVQRVLLSDFMLANPIYANARIYVFEADLDAGGVATATKATLYRTPYGSYEEENPLRLDGDGKLVRPVYVDEPVVARVTDAAVPQHDTGVIGIEMNFLPGDDENTTVSVEDYGADGGGTTLSTEAIQAAFSDVPTQGGTVLLPENGRYVFNTPLYIKPRTKLTGGGWLVAAPDSEWVGSARRGLMNLNWEASSLTDEDIIIEGITIDYRGIPTSAYTRHCIYMRRATRVVARGNTVLGGDSSVAFLGCDDTFTFGNRLIGFRNCGADHWDNPRNARVIGNYLHTQNSAQMINFNPEPTSMAGTGHIAKGLVVSGNILVSEESTATPSQIEPLAASNRAEDVSVTGNIGCNVWWVARGDVRAVAFVGNTLSDFRGNTAAFLCGGQFDETPKGLTLKGNIIRDPLTTSPNGAVIYVTSDRAIISGNTIEGTAYTVAAIGGGAGKFPVSYGNNVEKAQATNGYLRDGFRLLNGAEHFLGFLNTDGTSSRIYTDGSNSLLVTTRKIDGTVRTVLQMNALSDTSALRVHVPLGMNGLFYVQEASGLTATGSTAGGALLLEAQCNQIATTAAGTGVRLMNVSFYGLEVTVWNDGANDLNVYPTLGGAFEGLGINVPIVLPAGSVGAWQFLGTAKWRTKSMYP